MDTKSIQNQNTFEPLVFSYICFKICFIISNVIQPDIDFDNDKLLGIWPYFLKLLSVFPLIIIIVFKKVPFNDSVIHAVTFSFRLLWVLIFIFFEFVFLIAVLGGLAICSGVSSKLKKLSTPTIFINRWQSYKNLFILLSVTIVVAILEDLILRVHWVF